MSHETAPVTAVTQSAARDTLIAILRSAHALEKQQITVLDTHLELFEDFPDLHTRVTQHIVDTREQARRLEACLEACGSSSSMFKDAVLSIMGLGQASVQGLGDDAVLKAVSADIMQEHLEIATYRMMLILAEAADMPEIRPRLQESLREEEAMAIWFDENLDSITRRFVEVKALDRQADLTPAADAQTPDGDTPSTVWQTLENAKQENTKERDAAHPDAASPSAETRDMPARDPSHAPRTPVSAPGTRDD